MVQRSFVLVFRLIGWLVASVAIILAIVLWRLASEPISLDRLTPYVEAALNPDDARIAVEVGRTQAQLTESGIELVVLDVRGIGRDGEPVFALPEVEVDLSLRALFLHAMLAPVRLAAEAPSLALVRRQDGSIGLGGMIAGEPESESAFDIGAVITAHLMEPSESDEPLSYLQEVQLSGGEVTLEDRITGGRLVARNAALVLAPRPHGIGARLSFLLQGGASVRAVAQHARGGGRIAFDVRFDRLKPADIADLLPPLPFAPQGVQLALSGRVAGDVTPEGTLSPLRFSMRAADGIVDLPAYLSAPLAIDQLAARGTLGSDLAEVEVESFELQTRGASVAGTALVRWDEQGPTVTADLRAENVEATDLELLWPPDAADGARKWVLENITTGIVTSVGMQIDLQPDDLDHKPLRREAVSGRLDYRDLSVRYFRDLPPLSGIDGSATFDGQSMTFQVDDGGYGELEVQDGTVRITGIGIEGKKQTQLEVEVNLTGPLPAALTLIDRPPFGFATELGVDPTKTSGTTRTELRVGLPLYKEVETEEVRIAADAVLQDVTVANLVGGVGITDGALTLAVDRERMKLSGLATVRGVALEVDWREYFADDAEFDRRYQLRGSLDEAQFDAVGLNALPVPIGGGLHFDVIGTQAGETHSIDAALDVTPLAIEVPWLDWRKRPGEPASLDVVLTVGERDVVLVDSFLFNGAALQASGSLVLGRDPIELRRLALDRFSLRNQQGALFVERDGAALRVEVDAQSIDLEQLLGQEEESDGGLLGDEEPTPLELTVRADRLLYSGEALTDVAADLQRTRQGWRSGEASGRLPKGESFDLILEPRSDGSRLTLTSSDAGGLLRLMNQTQRISGGDLKLEVDIAQQYPEFEAEGTLRIEDFTLLDAPILARLLTLASLTGIGNLLGGEGIAMNRLKLPFALEGGVLTLDGGRLSGSQLGLTMDGDMDLEAERFDLRGTIVPFYTINRVIGKIPVIGDFLAGHEGEGAFAFTFGITGDFDDPEVFVNPLSVLAPGVFRELFSGEGRTDFELPETDPYRR